MTLSSLTDDERLDDEARSELALVRRNIELEARLIDDLLDLTRIARGKLQLSESNVDLHLLLNQVIENCRGEIAQKGVSLTSEFGAERPWVYGDSARLQQVIWNLLKNAIKFTPTGGRIRVSTEDAAEKICIDVTDTGIGIDATVLPKIFQRFEQGGSEVTRRFGGLGLGLSICKAIVKMHRGVIRAESRGTNWGSTFTVVLPSVGAPTRPEMAQTQRLRLAGLLPRRVLLVDDHVDTRETLARLLTRASYQVKTAGGIQAALKAAEESKFDILISDIGLPDGTGCELMRELKARHNLCGVAFSGFGMEEDVRRSLDAGFSTHLTKPVDFKRLKAAMSEALGTKANTDHPAASIDQESAAASSDGVA